MTPAVLFDLDGVLIDSREVWFPLLNAVAADLGYAPITLERFQAGWGQGVAADVRDFYPNSTVADITRHYADSFDQFADYLRVTPAASSLFAELNSRGVKVAVVTNTPSTLAHSILSTAGLTPDEILGADDVPRAKPHPDMLLEACRRFGVPPEQALMVGDTEFDRRAAESAGVPFLLYLGYGDHGVKGEQRLQQLEELLEYISL